MELKITELQVPGKISFNYEDLKAELSEKVKVYAALVYTEDQIADAKKDRADLNRLKKALNDERIRQEREFMQPFETFKAQVKELCMIVDKASCAIDAQVKAFDESQKQKKAEAIDELWKAKEAPGWMIRNDPKWLNASVSMKSIEEAIAKHLLQVQKDMDTLDSIGVCFEAMQHYQKTLDLNAAIAENARIKAQAEAKAKWEAEHAQIAIHEVMPSEAAVSPVVAVDEAAVNAKAEEFFNETRSWIGFQAFLTVSEAKALGEYLRGKGIKYKAI